MNKLKINYRATERTEKYKRSCLFVGVSAGRVDTDLQTPLHRLLFGRQELNSRCCRSVSAVSVYATLGVLGG